MQILRVSPRKLAWILILICICTVLHICFVNYAIDVDLLEGQPRDQFHFFGQLFLKPHFFTNIHRVLLWNEFGEAKNLQCETPGNRCIFKTRTNFLSHHIDYTKIDYIDFDAIIFNEDVLNSSEKPYERRDTQIYIFWSLLPSGSGPVCTIYNDGFFNWTFTYRLDSTLVWNQFFVRHKHSRKIVAPKMSVIWEMNNDGVKPHVERILNKKTEAVAWIFTDCKLNQPIGYITDLQENMKRFGLFIHVFSNCTQNGSNFLPESSKLNGIIEKHHFLIVSEDHTAEDYVSDKILLAYNNYAIPIVYGAANYSRFLPPGSYINTKAINPYSLACIIKQAVEDPRLYEGFFNWTNVYEISANPPEQNPLCKLCEALIKEKDEPSRKTIANFSQWWNTPEDMKSCCNTGN